MFICKHSCALLIPFTLFLNTSHSFQISFYPLSCVTALYYVHEKNKGGNSATLMRKYPNRNTINYTLVLILRGKKKKHLCTQLAHSSSSIHFMNTDNIRTTSKNMNERKGIVKINF